MDEPYESDLFLSHAATAVLLHLLNSESAGAVRKQRQSIVDWINDLSEKSIGLRSYLIGDSLSKSNLLIRSHPFTTRPPSFEKIDITLFYDKSESPQHERWFLSLCEALSNHSSSASLYSVPSNEACDRASVMKTGVVDRVTYFPAVRKLEAVIDRTIVSIRPNDVNSLAFALLFEELNALTGGEDLLKRSILLIKAWCFFEAPNIMGKGTATNSTAQCGAASENTISILCSDKVIEVMVMWLFSSSELNKPQAPPVRNPFKALLRFLSVYSNFDWNKWAVGATGLIALPADSISAACEEDIGTETDSCFDKGSNRLQSMESPYSQGNPSKIAIVNNYRARLFLQPLPAHTIGKPSSRRRNSETDEEDGFSDIDAGESPAAPAARVTTAEDTRRLSTESKLSGRKRMNSLMQSRQGNPSPVAHGEVCILDPTKQWTNLFTAESYQGKSRRPSVKESESSHFTPATQQNILHQLFSVGLQNMKESIEASSLWSEEDSGEADGDRAMCVVKRTFPVLSKASPMETSTLLNGAVLGTLLRTDINELAKSFADAEAALGKKMRTDAVEEVILRTVADKGPQNVQDITDMLENVPAAIGWLGDDSATKTPRLRSLLKQNTTKFSVDSQDLVHLAVASIRAGKDENNADCETMSDVSSAMISAFPTPSTTREAQDNLEISDRNISKSFSSFESDQGSDYFINLQEGQLDPNMRYYSQYTTPLLSRESSGTGILPRDSSISSIMGVRTPSSGTTSAGAMSQADDDKNPYHQHQKTLLRRSQTLSRSSMMPSSSIISAPRTPEVTHDSGTPTAVHTPPHPKTQTPSPTTTPPSSVKLPAPFIQPFVVKELQVWVPGKFGSGSNTTVPASKTPPLPIAGTKSFKSVYPSMASGPHMGVSPPPPSDRYSPIPGASNRAPAQTQSSYMYHPPQEEEYDVNWIDSADDRRANRSGLVGHQQLSGQLSRDRIRPNAPSDHHLSQQHSLSRSSRSPASDLESPHSGSPTPPGCYMSTQANKRIPAAMASAFIAQTNRLNYGGSNSNFHGIVKASSSPLLQCQNQSQSQRDMRRDCSPVIREHSPMPLDRSPMPLDRSPMPLDRSPMPLDRSPMPLDRSPMPLDRSPQRSVLGLTDPNDFDHWSLSSQQISSHLPRQQHQHQQQQQQSLYNSPCMGGMAESSFSPGSGSRMMGIKDAHYQEQLHISQQQLRLGGPSSMSEKVRVHTSTLQREREKSEAQLPSFLRDL